MTNLSSPGLQISDQHDTIIRFLHFLTKLASLKFVIPIVLLRYTFCQAKNVLRIAHDSLCRAIITSSTDSRKMSAKLLCFKPRQTFHLLCYTTLIQLFGNRYPGPFGKYHRNSMDFPLFLDAASCSMIHKINHH